MLHTPVVAKLDQEFSIIEKNFQQPIKSEKVTKNVRSILSSIVQHSLTPREIFCFVIMILFILTFVIIIIIQEKQENHPVGILSKLKKKIFQVF